MNAFIRFLKSIDAPKRSKQLQFESIYTESLTVNWMVSSQYSPFLCRQIDVVLGSMMQSPHSGYDQTQ